MKFLLILFFLCFSILLNGQNTSQKDTLAHFSFKELEDKFYKAKPDSLKAVLYAKYYTKKANSEKDTLRMADGNYYLSDITKDSTYFVNYWRDIIRKTKHTNNELYPAVSYLELGDFYYQRGLHDNALKEYLLAKKTTNDSLMYISIHRIGLVKGSLKKSIEAIYLYKKVYNYYKKQEPNKNYISLLNNLSTSFFRIKEYDSALFYNKKAHQAALNYKNKYILGYNIYARGKLNYNIGKYFQAINDFKKSILLIINDENFAVISQAYFNIAISYSKLNKIDKTVKYYLKIDSLFLETQNYYKSQKPAYKFLTKYYKKNKNDDKQLEYINKYIKVDSVLNARAKKISKDLVENYDIPNLISERKAIENRLKNKLSNFEKWIWSIGVFSLIISCFLFFQARKRKQYKKRFLELLEKNKNQPKTVKAVPKKANNTIPKEVVTHILACLEQFESNQAFISSELTLNELAKTFSTNANYLSKVINHYKHQSFTNYMNQLRINYTVEKLKNDKRFRKYNIKAIAGEVGFNNAESFSKAFYKNTGIKPSYFITELEKQQ